jgi:hypothetical protein
LKDEKIGRMRHVGAWGCRMLIPIPGVASSIRETLHELVTADACANRTPALSLFRYVEFTDFEPEMPFKPQPIYAFIFQM